MTNNMGYATIAVMALMLLLTMAMGENLRSHGRRVHYDTLRQQSASGDWVDSYTTWVQSVVSGETLPIGQALDSEPVAMNEQCALLESNERLAMASHLWQMSEQYVSLAKISEPQPDLWLGAYCQRQTTGRYIVHLVWFSVSEQSITIVAQSEW